MDYFLVSKHQIVEENILFTSKMLYQLLDSELHVDELFLKYASKRNIILNLNIERILYLSLTLLFAMGLISANQNMIMRAIQ
ncbi:ABC-three component system middle component 6 [Paenibacillus polysaccharolyticus]|uniref:ABC-three component system middle component 6 n=1 Tax=Paenibacillus polysaccharolyticus TaxID=582692 RepID=UPI0030080F89